MTMEKTTLIIADDHRILRQGLVTSFNLEKRFRVIAEAASGQEAIRLALEHSPDIILMDITMPDLNGMEATRQILAKKPRIKIIALSMHTQKLYVMGMLDAGVSGYLSKTCSFKELVEAVNIVLSGKIYLCHDIAKIVVDRALASQQETRESQFSLLSHREMEILQLIAEGHKNKDIAEKLHISVKTVQIHRTHLKKKLSIDNTADLTKYAISKGITSMDYPLPHPKN